MTEDAAISATELCSRKIFQNNAMSLRVVSPRSDLAVILGGIIGDTRTGLFASVDMLGNVLGDGDSLTAAERRFEDHILLSPRMVAKALPAFSERQRDGHRTATKQRKAPPASGRPRIR